MRGFPLLRGPLLKGSSVPVYTVIVDFFVKAKLSIGEGFSTNEGFLCSEKSIGQA